MYWGLFVPFKGFESPTCTEARIVTRREKSEGSFYQTMLIILNQWRRETGRLADGQATAKEPTGFLNMDIFST